MRVPGAVALTCARQSAAKRTVTHSEWDKALSRQVNLSRTDLNRLVMDYLVIEGYQSAAEAFAQESGLQPSVDLASIATRMHIRTAVQSGDIETAIGQVNELDPDVLDRDPALFFRLQQQRLIELIRQGHVLDALAFAADELAPLCEENPLLLPQLEKSMALLVFDAPAGANGKSAVAPPPGVSELLAPTHRLQTAGELNAAILAAQSQNRDPKLLQLLRMLVFGQQALGPTGPGRTDFPLLDLSSAIDPIEVASAGPPTSARVVAPTPAPAPVPIPSLAPPSSAAHTDPSRLPSPRTAAVAMLEAMNHPPGFDPEPMAL